MEQEQNVVFVYETFDTSYYRPFLLDWSNNKYFELLLRLNFTHIASDMFCLTFTLKRLIFITSQDNVHKHKIKISLKLYLTNSKINNKFNTQLTIGKNKLND